MIKRHYFMSVEKPHNDGTGGYAYNTCTADYTSWLPKPDQVYKDMSKHIANEMKDLKGDKIQILSFNRI